jgi:hypothetical protein
MATFVILTIFYSKRGQHVYVRRCFIGLLLPEFCMKIRMKFKSNIYSATYGKHGSVEEYPTGKANGSHQFSIIFTLRASRRLPSAALARACNNPLWLRPYMPYI